MKTLYSKLMMVQFGCGLLVVALLFGLLDINLTDLINEDFAISGRTLADALAKHIEPAMVNRDYTSAQSVLDASLKAMDMKAAFVTGPSGEVLAHTFIPQFPDELRNSPARPDGSPVDLNQSGSVTRLTFFSKPVLTGIVGTVHVGLSQERLVTATGRMKLVLLGSVIVVILTALLIFAGFARAITTPISTLTNETQRFGSNVRAEFTPLRVRSDDEVGTLTQAFNRMVAEIQGHAADLDEAVRTATQQVREREAQTRLIVDNALDAVLSMNASGLVTDWNAQAETILGWSREEAIGQKLSTLIIPEQYRAMHDRGLQHFLATGEGPVLNKRIEITALHRDGHGFPVELTVSPLNVGGVYIFSAFLRDISQRKQAEEDLKNAKDTAEAANRAKSEFLANMSHEIRTPMNGVLGMAELLLATGLTDTQRRYAETVHRSGTSLLEIINSILDFSKIEAGKLHMESVDFDFRETIEEAVSLIAERAQAKGLELACHIPDATPTRLQGDPVRVSQILTNLVGNAIKFTERGEVVVRVSTKEQTPDKAVLRVEVQDTGIGIPKEVQESIFQAFSQADGSTTRKFGGTGLGLTIVRQLVGLMHGEIGVKSAPGAGSTFWFTLCLDKQPAQTTPSRPPLASLQGLRVLIVDDNATSRNILEQYCESWGMYHASAESGSQALVLLQEATTKQAPFDLAILDKQMPGMDGLALARAIKQDPTLDSIRLVMLTAYGRQGDEDAAEQAGISVFQTKPVRQSQLYDCLAIGMATGSHARSKPYSVPTETAPVLYGRILLAEDNPVNQEVAEAMLKSLGCQVQVVGNGQAAVNALFHTPYDIVLMDCQMPVMDGFVATAAIRKNKHTIPIIAVTANAIAGDRERCLAAGMNDYLSKPFTNAKLREILERWLPRRTASQLAEPAPTSEPAPCPATIEHKAWDAIRALQRKGQPDMLAKVMAMYLDSSRTLVESLRQAVPAQDATAVREAAHSLKSSSATLGAVVLAGHCKELEAMGQAQTLLQAAEMLSRLEAEYAAVCEAFHEELQMGNRQ